MSIRKRGREKEKGKSDDPIWLEGTTTVNLTAQSESRQQAVAPSPPTTKDHARVVKKQEKKGGGNSLMGKATELFGWGNNG